MALISVNIPVFNGEAYIADAIHSVLQNKADMEVIVFDDGSTDKTRSIIEKIIQDDTRVRLITSQQKTGIAAARQHLLKESSGEFFAPFDADDIMQAGWLDTGLAILKSREDIAAVYGKSRFISQDGEDLQKTHGSPYSRINCYECHPVPHGSVIARRQAIDAVGGYLETGASEKSVLIDFFIWARLSIRFEMLFVDSFTYYYRKHDNQITTKTDRFPKAMKYIQNYLLAKDSSLTENIMSPDFQVPNSATDKRLCMFILGVLLSKYTSGDKIFGELLEKARQVDPEDYGLYLKMYNHFMALKRYRVALNSARKLTEWQGECSYPRIPGHFLMKNYYEARANLQTAAHHSNEFCRVQAEYSKLPN
jgi:glycosyltransferase involved in cell wall biosynthesis